MPILGALALACGGVAGAQEPPRLPNAVPSREQVEQPRPEPSASAARAHVDADEALRTAPCPLETSAVRVTLTGVRFQSPAGTAVAAPIAEALRGVDAGPRGEQPVRVVCAIRDSANAALRDAGYIASVQIPPQTIAGELLLTVVTARITEIRVHGEPGHYRQALLATIARLRALDPVNQRDAERLLLLAGDIPGLDVQLSLRPAGTAPGAVIGDLTITRRSLTALANAQNYGSRQLGRETAYLRVETYGLLTSDDVVYAGASTTRQTREQQVAQAGYITGIGGDGLTLGVRVNYAWSRPDLGELDLRSRSLIAGLDVSLPLVRSVATNLTLGGGAELIEQRTRVFDDAGGSTPLNRDKLRILFVKLAGGTRLRRADGTDRLSLTGGVELRKGLAVLGATRAGEISSPSGYTPSRFGADPQALVIRANGAIMARAGPVSAAAELRAQWTDKPLLNFEEFAIGNLSVGRGYDPGANSGDRALGLANELRVDLPLFAAVPTQLFAFGDVVWLRNLDQGAIERRRTLASFGGGWRVTLPGRLLLELIYAKPLDKALRFDDRPPAARLLASLTAQFAPREGP